MSNCPACETGLDDDFGLVTCGGCGAAVFIDMDGQVKINSDIEDADAAQGPNFASPPQAEEPSPNEQLSEFLVEEVTRNVAMSEGQMLAESASDHMDALSEQFPDTRSEKLDMTLDGPDGFNERVAMSTGNDPFNDLASAPHGEEAAHYSAEQAASDAPHIEQVMPDDATIPIDSPHFSADATAQMSNETTIPPVPDEIDEPLPEQAPPAPHIPAQQRAPESSDLGDVAAFGNSEESLGREGSLRFNIFISGIETASLRKAIKEVMDDNRFIWDADSLLKSTRDGCLRLTSVPSVKAAIFIQRIKHLPVGLAWEQYDIHQA